MTQATPTSRAAARALPGRIWLRGAAMFAVLTVCLWLLAQRIGAVDPAAVAAALAAVTALQWGAALALTGISFWAVGRYDAVLHRHMGTGVAGPRARRAGIAAIAIGQTLGLGVVTGALVRWRMLPGLSLWRATRISAAVALSFLAGWAVVTSAVLVVFPLPDAPVWLGLPGLALAVLGAALCLVQPGGGQGRWRLPSLFTAGRIAGLAAVDCVAAGLALWVLMPAELGLAPGDLLAVYLLALGAGLTSGTPAGMGPFEMTLLTLLHPADPAAVLAGIVAFRLVFYALPALAGALLALRPPRAAQPGAPSRLSLRRPPAGAAAEYGLIRQGALTLLPLGRSAAWLTGRTPHVLVALRDPAGDVAQPVQALARAARVADRRPCLYKAGPRMAARARAAGWCALPVAWELHLDPRRFSLDGPALAGLRRKLRRADRAGVAAARITRPDLDAMAAINADWAARHGGERGFSMGRFDPLYVLHQRIYGATLGGRLIAFATFHACAGEWTLDLMRHLPDVPDGTMHALIHAALEDAARAGVPRLSLAAAPVAGFGLPAPLGGWLARRQDGGLDRFKSGFAPARTPLYLCAPDRFSLALAAWEILRAVRHPPPLAQTGAEGDAPPVQDDLEEYRFAS